MALLHPTRVGTLLDSIYIFDPVVNIDFGQKFMLIGPADLLAALWRSIQAAMYEYSWITVRNLCYLSMAEKPDPCSGFQYLRPAAA